MFSNFPESDLRNDGYSVSALSDDAAEASEEDEEQSQNDRQSAEHDEGEDGAGNDGDKAKPQVGDPKPQLRARLPLSLSAPPDVTVDRPVQSDPIVYTLQPPPSPLLSGCTFRLTDEQEAGSKFPFVLEIFNEIFLDLTLTFLSEPPKAKSEVGDLMYQTRLAILFDEQPPLVRQKYLDRLLKLASAQLLPGSLVPFAQPWAVQVLNYLGQPLRPRRMRLLAYGETLGYQYLAILLHSSTFRDFIRLSDTKYLLMSAAERTKVFHLLRTNMASVEFVARMHNLNWRTAMTAHDDDILRVQSLIEEEYRRRAENNELTKLAKDQATPLAPTVFLPDPPRRPPASAGAEERKTYDDKAGRYAGLFKIPSTHPDMKVTSSRGVITFWTEKEIKEEENRRARDIKNLDRDTKADDEGVLPLMKNNRAYGTPPPVRVATMWNEDAEARQVLGHMHEWSFAPDRRSLTKLTFQKDTKGIKSRSSKPRDRENVDESQWEDNKEPSVEPRLRNWREPPCEVCGNVLNDLTGVSRKDREKYATCECKLFRLITSTPVMEVRRFAADPPEDKSDDADKRGEEEVPEVKPGIDFKDALDVIRNMGDPWVRTLSNLPKGTYLAEFVGELRPVGPKADTADASQFVRYQYSLGERKHTVDPKDPKDKASEATGAGDAGPDRADGGGEKDTAGETTDGKTGSPAGKDHERPQHDRTTESAGDKGTVGGKADGKTDPPAGKHHDQAQDKQITDERADAERSAEDVESTQDKDGKKSPETQPTEETTKEPLEEGTKDPTTESEDNPATKPTTKGVEFDSGLNEEISFDDSLPPATVGSRRNAVDDPATRATGVLQGASVLKRRRDDEDDTDQLANEPKKVKLRRVAKRDPKLDDGGPYKRTRRQQRRAAATPGTTSASGPAAAAAPPQNQTAPAQSAGQVGPSGQSQANSAAPKKQRLKLNVKGSRGGAKDHKAVTKSDSEADLGGDESEDPGKDEDNEKDAGTSNAQRSKSPPKAATKQPVRGSAARGSGKRKRATSRQPADTDGDESEDPGKDGKGKKPRLKSPDSSKAPAGKPEKKKKDAAEKGKSSEDQGTGKRKRRTPSSASSTDADVEAEAAGNSKGKNKATEKGKDTSTKGGPKQKEPARSKPAEAEADADADDGEDKPEEGEVETEKAPEKDSDGKKRKDPPAADDSGTKNKKAKGKQPARQPSTNQTAPDGGGPSPHHSSSSSSSSSSDKPFHSPPPSPAPPWVAPPSQPVPVLRIDATEMGNWTRFVRLTDVEAEANVEFVTVSVGAYRRMVLRVKDRAIGFGSELVAWSGEGV